MEKRGVRFKIPNSYGKFIVDVLMPINFANYNWQISNDQILIRDKQEGVPLFTKRYIDGEKFFNLVNNNTYYMIFAILKAFPQGAHITDINTYKDFLNSNCEIIMMVADSSYIDVYCKDALLVQKIYDNAKLKKYSNIEFIDENDSRIGMYV